MLRCGWRQGDILLDQHNEYIKNTLDPTFKKFKVRAPKEGRLFIQCCDHDFKSTDIIGECTIDVRAQTHHSYCAAISLLSAPGKRLIAFDVALASFLFLQSLSVLECAAPFPSAL